VTLRFLSTPWCCRSPARCILWWTLPT
jgi:hypothetical protein